MNPYLITGPAQIGISGGRTSGHMVYKILEAHGGTLFFWLPLVLTIKAVIG